MIDVAGHHKEEQQPQNWLLRAAEDAYKHPTAHLGEIATAAAVIGGVVVAHRLSLKLLGTEVAAAKEAAMERIAPRFLSRTASELGGPITEDLERAGRRFTASPITDRLGQASEYRLTGLPDNQTFRDQLAALKGLAKPVNYKEILGHDTQVAIFAESHPVDEVRAEIGRQMPELKKMGYTHLVMEALPATRQGLIENYYANKATDEAVLSAFKKDWGWSPGTYKYLVETAKENGIKVVAADIRDVKLPNAALDFAQQSALRDQAREANWARIIGETIKAEPDAKIAVLAGSRHTVLDPQNERLTTLLSRQNLKHKVIEYTAGWQDMDRREPFDETVALARMAKERFMVQLNPKTATRPADYFVHLPSLYD